MYIIERRNVEHLRRRYVFTVYRSISTGTFILHCDSFVKCLFSEEARRIFPLYSTRTFHITSPKWSIVITARSECVICLHLDWFLNKFNDLDRHPIPHFNKMLSFQTDKNFLTLNQHPHSTYYASLCNFVVEHERMHIMDCLRLVTSITSSTFSTKTCVDNLPR